MEYSPEIFITYLLSENYKNEKIKGINFIDKINNSYKESEIKLNIDKVNIVTGGKMFDFVGESYIGKFVIVIVNEIYLKTETCLSELYVLADKSFPFYKIIFVYVGAIKLFENINIIDFYHYFSEKIKYLNEKEIKITNFYQKKKIVAEITMLQDVEKYMLNVGSFSKTYNLNRYNELDELIKEIVSIINTEFRNEKEYLIKISLPNYVNQCPYYNPKNLIGRENSLKALSELLDKNKIMLMESGIPGIGKTTLAKAYINDERYYNKYDNIAWVTVSNNIFENFIDQLSKSEQLISYRPNQDISTNFKKLYKELQKFKGNNLMVVDSANNHDDLYEFIQKIKNTNWTYLFISQVAPDKILSEKLDKLETEPTIELFYKHYKKEKNDRILSFLLNMIENHTLIVELMAKVANHNDNLNILKLYEIIRKAKMKPPFIIAYNELKKFVSDEFINLERNLYRYIAEIFALENFTTDEIKYLRYFTILPPYEMYESILIQFFGIQESENSHFNYTLNNLVRKGWLHNGNEAYSIHILLQPVLLRLLNPNSENCLPIINFFIKNIESQTEERIIKNKSFLPYAESVAYSLFDNSLILINLIEKVAEFYLKLDNIQKCLAYNLLALNIKEFIFSNDYEKLANSYNEISNLHSNLGNYEQDLFYAFKALEIRKLNENNDVLKLAESYNNIAITYRGIKNYKKSLEYHLMDLNICENNLTEDDVNLANSYFEIAITYYYRKDYFDAKIYIDKALAIWKQKFNYNSQDLLNAIEIQEIINRRKKSG